MIITVGTKVKVFGLGRGCLPPAPSLFLFAGENGTVVVDLLSDTKLLLIDTAMGRFEVHPKQCRVLKPTKPKIWISHDTMKKIQSIDPRSTECIQVGVWNNPPDQMGGSFYKAVRSEKTKSSK